SEGRNRICRSPGQRSAASSPWLSCWGRRVWHFACPHVDERTTYERPDRVTERLHHARRPTSSPRTSYFPDPGGPCHRGGTVPHGHVRGRDGGRTRTRGGHRRGAWYPRPLSRRRRGHGGHRLPGTRGRHDRPTCPRCSGGRALRPG